MKPTSLSVALINPPHVARLNREFESGVPPLGLGSIAAHLRANGVLCDVFDLADEWPLDTAVLESMRLFQYDVFGLTSYSMNFFAAEILLTIIRDQCPGAYIVLGGPHAGAIPEQVLRTVSGIDFVVRNEGEAAMLRLVQELESASPRLDQVPNLFYRKDGDIIASLVSDKGETALDNYSWPLRESKVSPAPVGPHLRRDGKLVRKEFFTSSRGCPKRCTFCSIIVMSPQYRYRSASSLMEEIRQIYAQSPFGHITFLDANFFVNWRRAREFSERLHEFDPTITWSGTATTDQVCQQWETVLHIGSLNCSSLEIGIENGSNSILKRYNKKTSVDQNLTCIEILRASRIKLELDYIMFDPFISVGELEENVSFIERANLTDYAPADHLYSAVKLYPGTAVRAEYAAKHHLAEDDFSIPPFEDKQVQAIFDAQIWFARRYLHSINLSLGEMDKSLECALAGSRRGACVDPLHVSQVLIALREAPFAFFESLVMQSSSGDLKGESSEFLENIVNVLKVPDLLSGSQSITDTCAIPDDTLKPSNRKRARLTRGLSGFYLISDIVRPIALSPAGLDLVESVWREHSSMGRHEGNFGEIQLPETTMQQLLSRLGIATPTLYS